MSIADEAGDPIWVAAVAMVNESGCVLMQQRRLDSEHGGLWEFPGGKVEAGEAVSTAAVRELAEELGVTVDPAALRAVTFAHGWTENRVPPLSLTILLFSCSCWQGDPEARAAMRIAWIPPHKLAALPMPPLDYPLAAALEKMLAGNSH